MADSLTLDLGHRTVDVTVRRSAIARRMSLRIDPAQGPVLTLPARTPLRDGERFVAEHRIWIAEKLARLPQRVAFVPGAVVPVLGIDHAIIHDTGIRRGTWIADGAIRVGGEADFVPRRVADFLRAEARRLIVPQAQEMAGHIGRRLGRVSVKDTRSRWGSCSAAGDLAFSWRLVLAPDWVLTYVVAHEVAHLAELNHSAAFWRVVDGLVPDADSPQSWLKRFGARLHRYG